MRSNSPELLPIYRKMDGVRKSARLGFLSDGFGRLLTALSLFCVATFLLDWWLILPAYVRLAFLAAGAILALSIVARYMIYPLVVPLSDDDIAVFIERRYPELSERLLSSLQLSRQEETGRGDMYNSPLLVDSLVKETASATDTMDFHAVVTRRHVVKTALTGICIAAVIAGAAVIDGNGYASIYFNRLFGMESRWPKRTDLAVLGFDANGEKVIARGDDLIIEIKAQRKIPSKVSVKYRFESGEQGVERTSIMEGGLFKCAFNRVTGPFEFYAEGGDDSTGVYRVKTLNPPTIESVQHLCNYPAYLKFNDTPGERPIQGGNVSAPLFTNVTVEAFCDEDLASASFVFVKKDREESRPMRVEGKKANGGFAVGEEFSDYYIMVTALNGLKNREPIRYAIKTVIDSAPHIVVHDPTSDEYVTPMAVRPISITTSDDFGVKEISFQYKIVTQIPPKEQIHVFGPSENTPPQYGEKEIKTFYRFDISALKLKQGDVIEYVVAASDYKDVGQPNVTETKKRRFTVVSVSQLQGILEAELNSVKERLRKLKSREERLQSRTADVRSKFGNIDDLTSDQRGEVKHIELEQSNVGQHLEKIRKDIVGVLKQGICNKVFDEASIAKIDGVRDIVTLLAGDPDDQSRAGKTAISSAHLRSAAKAVKASERNGDLEGAAAMENEIVRDITDALALLEEWATYQEVVRITRELLEDQEKVNQDIIRKTGGK